MSRIADRIRAYVNDYSVAEHYGEWGILRPDQRRQIRELCDTCDMFERTADELARKRSEWISVEERLPENSDIECLLFLDDEQIVIGWYHVSAGAFVEGGIAMLNKVTHWMPLPEAPKMKG